MHGGDRKTDQAASLPLELAVASVTQADAARMLNVSERGVRAAVQIRDHGTPALIEKVERGEVSVSAAADVARLPEPEQREVVARGEAEILAKAKEIRSERAIVRMGRDAIERAGSFDELRQIKAVAESMEKFQRSIGAAQDAMNTAAEIKVRAERRMGEALAEMSKAPGTPRVASCRSGRGLLREMEISSGPKRTIRSAISGPRMRVPLTTEMERRPSSVQASAMAK